MKEFFTVVYVLLALAWWVSGMLRIKNQFPSLKTTKEKMRLIMLLMFQSLLLTIALALLVTIHREW